MATLVGTWRMSVDGIAAGMAKLQAGASIGEAVVTAIRTVEDNPGYTSVGYGGLPAVDGVVRADAAYMDGATLRIGAVLESSRLRNPIDTAYALCGRTTNCVLTGEGAEQFAASQGISLGSLLTPESESRWHDEKGRNNPLSSYMGHDTVCVAGVSQGLMGVGTSTSGLFMKAVGRIGDTPLPGCGFYCDNLYGAAACTGLGEDLMRGVLAYEVVRQMELGQSAQQAAETALLRWEKRRRAMGEAPGEMSLIALAPDGSFGAATALPLFPFAVGTEAGVQLYAARYADGVHTVAPAVVDELQSVD